MNLTAGSLPDAARARAWFQARDIIGKMASTCGEVSGALVFSSEQFRKGTNFLLVKGTLHTGMKETRAKTTMITSASSDVGRSKKSLKKMMDKSRIRPLSVSKSRDVF